MNHLVPCIAAETCGRQPKRDLSGFAVTPRCAPDVETLRRSVLWVKVPRACSDSPHYGNVRTCHYGRGLGRIVEYEFATHTAWCYHIAAKIHGDNFLDLRLSFGRAHPNCAIASAQTAMRPTCVSRCTEANTRPERVHMAHPTVCHSGLPRRRIISRTRATTASCASLSRIAEA